MRVREILRWVALACLAGCGGGGAADASIASDASVDSARADAAPPDAAPTSEDAEPPPCDGFAVTATSGALVDRELLLVHGCGFGSKEQAAPIFHDMVDAVWVNGEQMSPHPYDGLADGDVIPTDEDQPWVAGNYGNLVRLSRNAPSYGNRRTHYRAVLESHDGWIGHPRGFPDPETDDVRRVYIRWYIRPSFDPAQRFEDYRRWYDMTYERIEDDRFRVRGGDWTEIFSSDRNCRLDTPTAEPIVCNIVESGFDGDSTWVRVGSESGAPCGTVPEGELTVELHQAGSHKFIRVWDTTSGREAGVRISWTQMHLTYQGGGPSWAGWSGEAGRWNLQEIYIDKDAGVIRAWTNGELVHDIDDFVPDDGHRGIQPRLWGLDGSGSAEWPGETVETTGYYADRTQARVEIGDAPTWESCTTREIQPPVAWEDGAIRVRLNQGALPSLEGAYLYVVRDDGRVVGGPYELRP